MNQFETGIAALMDIERQRETTRSTLAWLIIGLLSALALFITMWVLIHDGDPEIVVTGVFAPVIGIAGTVLGFYFGSQDNTQQQ